MAAEFGHFGFIGSMGCVDAWGAGPFQIEVCGKVFRFEDSDRFGPAVINGNGAIRSVQPNGKSPFWHAHFAWKSQGRRLADDGVTCIWREPKPETLWVRGRMIVKSDPGEPGGKQIVIRITGAPPQD